MVAANTCKRIIALSFDDGPSTTGTPAVLDVLGRHGVTATFFVLGREVRRYPDIVVRAARGGHEIANHTFDHVHADAITPTRLAGEIERTARALADAGVDEARLFRPPKGLLDAAGAAAVRRLGYTTIGWTASLDKVVAGLGVQRGVDAIVSRLRPGDIILGHDTGKETIRALPLLLARLDATGFWVVPVGTLLSAAHSPCEKTQDREAVSHFGR